ncbi:MAG: hypothetical protein D6E12_15300 [Desulfovibrio sp.]|nr:MAG: hypothetical protein D6E12_15300 [Desulfovibrio sp.]
MSKKKEFDWFDKPANRKLLWWLLYAVCILLVAVEPLLHRHAHFEEVWWADWGFAYYAALGFASCLALILLSKLLAILLKKKVDYYDD